MKMPIPPYNQLPEPSRAIIDYLAAVMSVPRPKGVLFESLGLRGATPAMDRRISAVTNYFGSKIPPRVMMHARKPRRAVGR